MMSVPDDPIQLRAWLGIVSRHAAATYWRTQRRVDQHEFAVLNDLDENGNERIESVEDAGSKDDFAAVELRAWLSALPEKERFVLTGLLIARMTESELAAQMRCSQSNISQIKMRALKHIRAQIVNDDD